MAVYRNAYGLMSVHMRMHVHPERPDFLCWITNE